MRTKDLIPDGMKGEELHEWLVANKRLLINQKKSEIKEADGISNVRMYAMPDGSLKAFDTNKASFKEDTEDLIERTSVINTTYWYDSHGDVHIDGLWKKSLAETVDNYLVQEHQFNFKGIISEDVKAFTKKMSWRDLGLDIDGTTEALIYVSQIEKSRNEFMFDQYKKNRVKNHSVGMRYVALEMAVNNEDWKEEFAVWNKYYSKIANKNEVDADGYFFAITQAKNIEGSAVVRGSNRITPTLPNKSGSTSTHKEAVLDTSDDEPQKFDILEAISKASFIK